MFQKMEKSMGEAMNSSERKDHHEMLPQTHSRVMTSSEYQTRKDKKAEKASTKLVQLLLFCLLAHKKDRERCEDESCRLLLR